MRPAGNTDLAVMAQSQIVTNFWDAAVLPPGYDHQVTVWREMIRANQYPTQCNNVCSLNRWTHTGGTMQNIRRIAISLMHAVLEGCAFVPLWPTQRQSMITTGLEMREHCARNNLTHYNCYFLPLSNCTGRGRTLAGLQATSFNASGGLERVARLTGLRSEVLIMGHLISWVMRPGQELQKAIHFFGASSGMHTNGARHRVVAMHLRRGDKFSLHKKHMKNHSWRIHPDTFIMWGRRVSANLGFERVFYMTDDQGPDANLTARAGPLFHLVPAPRKCAPSSNNGFNVGELREHNKVTSTQIYKNIMAGNPAVWAQRMRKTTATGVCGSEIWADDGIQFFAGVLLLAQCAAFIGLQISNIGAAIVELMSTQHYPPVNFDVLGDVNRGPFLSDEKVWINGIHSEGSLRPIEHERLANGDGTSTNGCWMCTNPPRNAVLPPDAALIIEEARQTNARGRSLNVSSPRRSGLRRSPISRRP